MNQAGRKLRSRAADARSVAAKREIRVLVIEDSASDAKLLTAELRRGGFAPYTERVADADALTRVLAAGHWDVALCDYSLPGFGAGEALALIGAETPDLPVIIVTGAVGEEEAARLMRLGARDLVVKDRLSRLVPAVEREIAEAETRRARRQGEERVRLLESISQKAAGVGTIAEALGTTLTAVCRTIHWDYGEAWIVDGETQVLKLGSVWFGEGRPLEVFREGSEIVGYRRLCEGMPGRVWFSGVPEWNENLGRDVQACQRLSDMQSAGIKTGIAVPVAGRSGILAVLMFMTRQKLPEDPDLVDLVSGATGQLAALFERIHAEQKLRDSEARLRAVTENLPGMIFSRLETADGGTSFPYISPGVKDLVGIEAETIMRRPEIAKETIHPEDRAAVLENNRLATETQTPLDHEYRLVKPDGEVIWTRSLSRPVRLENGNIVWHGVMLDVTDLKRAELARQESEERLQSIANNLPGYIFRRVRRRNGRIDYLYASPSVVEFLGVEAEEFLADGSVLSRIVVAEDYRRMTEAWERSAQELSPVQVEFRAIRPDGGMRWIRGLSHPRRLPDGEIEWDGLALDVTEEKAFQERLNYLAYHDPLTDLPNRALFEDRLEQALQQGERSGSTIAVLYVDLDQFKDVNDALGHEAGDLVLREAARRLTGIVRRSDTVSRLGGDEFALLQLDLPGPEGATILADKILNVLSTPFTIGNHKVTIGASIGIALSSTNGREDGIDRETVLNRADMAMYRAKQQGRNTYRFFAPEMDSLAGTRVAVRHDLRWALDQDEFELHYQPQIDLVSGRIVGAEALIRWRRPERGLQRPDIFIPIAEESGLIVPIGRWVLATACAEAVAWRSSGMPCRVAVNVSVVQTRRDDFFETVMGVIEETGLDPRFLELEITESIVIHEFDPLLELLGKLKELGVRLAIDDFGTGYASFQYLKRFPVDKVKVDQAFVKGMTVESSDAAILSAIVAVGRSRNFEVIAEGVETAEQRDFLIAEGCTTGQGYFYCKPVNAQEFRRVLAESTCTQCLPRQAGLG